MNEYLDKIISCSEKMRKLINDLLDFSKTSRAGKDFEQVDLNEVVKDVVKELNLLIEEKSATLNIDPLPAIQGLSHQLHQLFTNLIFNSLKFSNVQRKPQISITSKQLSEIELKKHSFLDKNRKYYQVTVQDNGIGFKQEFADQIFTIFQHLDSGAKYPGSGIGLALFRKIVTNHNGIIFADSTPEEGAAFHIIMPVEQ